MAPRGDKSDAADEAAVAQVEKRPISTVLIIIGNSCSFFSMCVCVCACVCIYVFMYIFISDFLGFWLFMMCFLWVLVVINSYAD